MKFILGKKLTMTQMFREDGTIVPVTRVQAGPCVITQVKTVARDGVCAVQVGFDETRESRLKKPQRGHLKGLTPVRSLRDFELETDTCPFKRGDVLALDSFNAGERVVVSGVSKGKGFQGVVKRHRFAGGPASHGHKDNLRMPGSIGAGGVQRVMKDVRMAGRMGGDTVTVKNLEVVSVNKETNELWLRGAVPGSRGSLIMICAQGEMKVVETPAAPAQASPAAPEAVAPTITQEAQPATAHEVPATATVPAAADSVVNEIAPATARNETAQQ